ncbi:MAG: PhzF family phenazine biosynthesis protein [Leptolyngbyaceae cyanobacterium SM1_3_5]|nr:PhzF family phenazine biosynthesis protein [Leptolyngbyaceae cyanobacterium SM1_3_5]
MGQAIVQVDAFTNKPFGGNPAAVCVLAAPQPDEWMQNVAMEMNLSETAFLVPRSDGYDLRWFTPAAEVALCGHATLASAHVLWSEGHLAIDAQARFHTKSGLLTADRREDWIELNFPVQPMQPVEPPDNLLAALGISQAEAVRHRTRQNQDDYLVELATEAEVRQLQPDFGRMLKLATRGAIVTSRASDYDFVSRYFAPGVGINEDPVTGYAHCCLAPYWQERLGKSEFLAYQASARGGVVKVRQEGDRVLLGGQAVTVMRGELV